MIMKITTSSYFPIVQQELMLYYENIDKIYCLLFKNKIFCSISTLSSFYGNLFPTSPNLSTEDHMRKLEILENLCPQLMTLQMPLSAEFDSTIELKFKIYSTASKFNIVKRRQFILEALFETLYLFYTVSYTRTIEKTEFFDLLRGGKLNEELRLFRFATNIQKTNCLYSDISFRHEDCSYSDFLSNLKELAIYRNQISHIECIRGQKPIFKSLDTLHPILSDRLKGCFNTEDTQLFVHQTIAIDAIRSGHNVAVSTATASGKSIVYNIPVLESIMENNKVVALYLFPTKALAQDQLRSIKELTGDGLIIPATACICDGDTTHAERFSIQEKEGNIILTNPDMLHVTLLPEHGKWTRIWRNLKYVAIDEAHCYRGAFGAHVAMVLRRLVRVCLYYSGRCPQFICCSATILNPDEHIRKLIPIDSLFDHTTNNAMKLTIVSADMDGSPRGERTFVIWNPYCQNNLAAATTQLPETGDDAVHIVTNESHSKPDAINLEKIGNNNMETGSHSHLDQFLEGCADRPATIGPSGSTAIDECNGVRYVGGWKRKKPSKAVKVDAQIENVVKHNSKKKRSDADCFSSPVLPVAATGDDSHSSSTVRRSTIYEGSQLLAALVKSNIRTLAFCKVRKLVELVLKYTIQDLEQTAPHLKDLVASYRGGYTMKERRCIEADLFSGKLIGVTATCALELGIDIGKLDATIHMGFPGTFSSLWQQAGRAGRCGRDSLSIMTCFDCPIDQYFARNPKILFHSPIEKAILDVDNIHVLRQHLLCAAKEIPLNCTIPIPVSTVSEKSNSVIIDSETFWGKRYLEAVEYLSDMNMIVPATRSMNIDSSHTAEGFRGSQCQWRLSPTYCTEAPMKGNPARLVNLRQIDPVTISIYDDTIEDVLERQIDSLGYSRAFFELYEGAIFMHRGKQFLVHKLDLASRVAHTRPVDVRYFTSARNKTSVNIIRTIDSMGVVHIGAVQVICSVYGYNKYRLGTNEIIEQCECTLPPLEYETIACWIDLPVSIKKALEEEGFCPIECMHGANHILVALSPVYAQCDPADIGTEHGVSSNNRDHPIRMMIFDTRIGGLGGANAVFESYREVIFHAAELLSTCPCETTRRNGCPSCILDARCSNYNNNISKLGALRLFRLLLAYMEEKQQAEGTPVVLVQHADRQLSSPAAGILPISDMAISLNEVSSSTTTTTTTAAAMAPFQSPPASSSSSLPVPSSTSSSSSADVTDSPRKKSRRSALQKSRIRNSVRAMQMAIQMNWTDSLPNFQTG